MHSYVIAVAVSALLTILGILVWKVMQVRKVGSAGQSIKLRPFVKKILFGDRRILKIAQ